MENSLKNRRIVEAYLKLIKGLEPCVYVHEFDAFHVRVWKTIDISESFYITWEKAVESYNRYCDELLKLK